jgi:hypothetical protein
VCNSRFETLLGNAALGQDRAVIEQLFHFGPIIIEYRREQQLEGVWHCLLFDEARRYVSV